MALYQFLDSAYWGACIRWSVFNVYREEEAVKVKELIQELYRHNQEADILIKDETAADGDTYWLDQLFFSSPEKDGGRENEETLEILARWE